MGEDGIGRGVEGPKGLESMIPKEDLAALRSMPPEAKNALVALYKLQGPEKSTACKLDQNVNSAIWMAAFEMMGIVTAAINEAEGYASFKLTDIGLEAGKYIQGLMA